MKYSKLFQHAGSLCLRHVNHCNTIVVSILIFWTKRHKIVEILALLSTKLSSSEMYKVGTMLFSIQWTLV